MLLFGGRHIPLLVIALASCTQGYGIEYPSTLTDTYSRQELDAGADCVVARVEELGLLMPSVAAKHVRAAKLVVSVYPEPIREGHPKCGILRAGNFDPRGAVTFAWRPGDDITRSSLQHELVHAILCQAQGRMAGPDCAADAGHDARAWWLPVIEPAQKCWAERLRGAP